MLYEITHFTSKTVSWFLLCWCCQRVEGLPAAALPRDKDPFWDPVEPLLLGTAHLWLQSLAFRIPLEEQLEVEPQNTQRTPVRGDELWVMIGWSCLSAGAGVRGHRGGHSTSSAGSLQLHWTVWDAHTHTHTYTHTHTHTHNTRTRHRKLHHCLTMISWRLTVTLTKLTTCQALILTLTLTLTLTQS